MKYVPKDLGEAADNSRGRASVWEWVQNAVLVSAFFGLLYLLLGVGANFISTHLPEKYEVELASRWAKSEHKRSERGEAILNKLLKTDRVRPLPYWIAVHDSQVANAGAILGGQILLTQGLLDSVSSQPGLAMVIAHELGHHHHRHTLSRVGRSLLSQLVLGLFFGQSWDSPLRSAFGGLEKAHSRAQETQADEFAMSLVLASYGASDENFQFFEMAAKSVEGNIQKWAALVSTHPYMPDRLDHLRGIQKRYLKTQNFEKESNIKTQ